MITKFRIFEKLDNEPQIGDYVVFDADFDYNLKSYIDNEIGKVISYNDSGPKYLVQYEKSLPSYFEEVTDEYDKISFFSAEIIFWSKDKEECELFLNAKKYNI